MARAKAAPALAPEEGSAGVIHTTLTVAPATGQGSTATHREVFAALSADLSDHLFTVTRADGTTEVWRINVADGEEE